MSEKNNNSYIKNIINPSINFSSLKARLRMNELKKELSETKYKNFFRKGNDIYSVSCSMNDKHSMNDIKNIEKKNSEKIHKELLRLDNDFNAFHKKFQKNLRKYKIKPLNEKYISDKNNKLIVSVQDNISKFLRNLHSVDYNRNELKNNNKENEDKKEIMGDNKINSINQEKNLIKKSNSINNINPLNINSDNSSRNLIDKSKSQIRRFISVNESAKKIKYRLNKFNKKNESKDETSSDNDTCFNSHKKLPLINKQSSFIMLSNPQDILYKYLNRNKSSRRLLPCIFNLQNLKY